MSGNSTNEQIDLSGQVAIVTGGGRGLGRAFAQALAKAGAAVAAIARSEDQLRETVQLIKGAGGHAIALTADVTDQQAVERVVAETERQLGPVDLLVNNAGRWQLLGEVWELDPEQWWREIEVNLRGPFLCARAVLPGMVARRRGRIINLASIAGLRGPAYASAYCISKTAVIRFSENLAAETVEHGVSVFAIHPGTLRTPMNLYWLESGIAALPVPMAQRFEWIYKFFEEGRDTPMEQPVQLVLFLASGRADALSGRYISVDDDLAEMVQRAEEIRRDELYTLRLRT
jgi:NAD(P)-dependent dehydrogenase (short-subunit alcohol dehydrogenase family)